MKKRVLAMIIAVLSLLFAFSVVLAEEAPIEVTTETTAPAPTTKPAEPLKVLYTRFPAVKGYAKMDDVESCVQFTRGKALRVVEEGEKWALVEYDVYYYDAALDAPSPYPVRVYVIAKYLSEFRTLVHHESLTAPVVEDAGEEELP